MDLLLAVRVDVITLRAVMSPNSAAPLSASDHLNRETYRVALQLRSAARPRSALSMLRRKFFAQAGESANRYHIGFERMLQHLWQARQFNRNLLVRSVA